MNYPENLYKYRALNGIAMYTRVKDDIYEDTTCKHLRKEYFGQKRYEGYHQRSDHPYGFGPTNGSIVEEVGLRNREKELSDEEVEAAVYFMTVWQRYNECLKEE